MSPLDADLIRRKLAIIARNLEDLSQVERLSLEDYQQDRFRLKGTERLLQELIDAAVDTNLHLLRPQAAPAATDYFQSFIEVGRRGIIPLDLAERLAPSAGLRNRLVHEYDRVDDRLVHKAVRTARREFTTYVAAVEGYLDRRERSAQGEDLDHE